jgi:hypothetical protein
MTGELGDCSETDLRAPPPEAEALRWHLIDTARALRSAAVACAASHLWSERLAATLSERENGDD